MIAPGATWSFAIALAPIVIVLLALVCRVPALWAGVIGVATAILGSITAFPVSASQASATASAMSATFLTVTFILLGGVGLAEITARSGAQALIAGWLHSTDRQGGLEGRDQLTIIVLIAYGVTPFMESVTGFGLGVVITAPLLIHLGLTPARAVTTGLLGLVLVPWGSLAPGTLVAADLGDVGFTELGVWSAVLSLPVLCVNVIAIVLVNRFRLRAGQWAFIAMVVGVEWLVLIVANAFVTPVLAGVLASGSVIIIAMARMRWNTGALPGLPAGFGQAMFPYGVLVIGLLVSAGLVGLIGLPSVAANPAVWLMIAVTATLVAYGRHAFDIPGMVRATLQRWWPVTAITLLFMVLGTVMSANGMASELATTAASMGSVSMVFIPAIGALGGYLTGSNTGAAAMFSTATTSAATQVSVNPLIALAAQNVAGSAAIIASPPRIALASSVAFAPGQKLPATNLRILLLVLAVLIVLLGAVVPVLSG